MFKNASVLVAIAWSALALSAARPATAEMLTGQPPAGYVTCGSQSANANYDACGVHWNYTQSIRFVTNSCSSGACSSDSSVTYVESVYPIGRKVASSGTNCYTDQGYLTGQKRYGLGTCLC